MRSIAVAFLLGLAVASPAGAQESDSLSTPPRPARPRVAAPT